MSSTNKTSHYNLSQYVGTDKPTYLVDYNADMSAIDTGIYAAKNEADTNTTAIGTLTNLTTESKSNLVGAINEVDAHADTNAGNIATNTTNIATNTGHIGTMTNLETTEKSNLVGATNELKAAIDNFNLSSYNTLDTTYITSQGNTITPTSYVTIAKNSDGSLAKIYGEIVVNNPTSSLTIVIANTGLAPASEFTINNAGIVRLADTNGNYIPSNCNIKLKTNGNIEIERSASGAVQIVIWLFPMLYWIKDFGDVPVE